MVAIVVEGKRDVKFFNTYITQHLNVPKEKYKIIKTDGKSLLLDSSLEKYNGLQDDIEANRIRKVLFIVDSDNNHDNPDIGGYNNSTTKITELITNLNLTACSDYFIACDPTTQEGTIENLVVSTLTQEQAECINQFLQCSELENDDGKRLLGIYNYGYPERPYDFNHQNFTTLKQKLNILFE